MLLSIKSEAMKVGCLVVGIASITAGTAAIYYVARHPIPRGENINKGNLQLLLGVFAFVIPAIVLIAKSIPS